MILANHLSRKPINEKEMKFSYFFFFIGKLPAPVIKIEGHEASFL